MKALILAYASMLMYVYMCICNDKAETRNENGLAPTHCVCVNLRISLSEKNTKKFGIIYKLASDITFIIR